MNIHIWKWTYLHLLDTVNQDYFQINTLMNLFIEPLWHGVLLCYFTTLSHVTQLLPKVLKEFLVKGLCKNICNMLISIHKFKFNNISINLTSQGMKFKWNVFSLWKHNRVLRDSIGTSIITHDRYWIIKLNFYLF